MSPEPSPEAVRAFLIAQAKDHGFHRVAVVPIEPPRRYQAYRAWINSDMHGTMAYMAAPEHVQARADIGQLASTARTLVVVALAYDHDAGNAAEAEADAEADADADAEAEANRPIRGLVARYARGADYHHVIKQRLYAMADALSRFIGRPVAARPCTDSAPVLERDLAERAGLGFVAKNTMLITPGLGSYTVLGELLLDVDAAPSAPVPQATRCGRCRACLDACPTGAFRDPYVLDARLCISYLTIEHDGVIARELRPLMGRMIFGCDICQEVCPFNAAAPRRNTPDPALAPLDAQRGAPDLLALLALGANQRRRYIANTPLRRASRAKLVRNICIALGNAGDSRAVEPLARLLADDTSALVRGHAAWALARLGGSRAHDALTRAADNETEPWVCDEIADALHQCRAKATSAGDTRG